MGIEHSDFQAPGQYIRALLEERGWTNRTLAIVLSADESGINRLIADKRIMTIPLALMLGDVFGVPAEKFLELQQKYELAKARITARPDPSRAVRAQLFGGLPIAEMIKRGWLPGVDQVLDVPGVEAALAKFFGVASSDEIEILPHAAKKTLMFTEPTSAQLAWLYRVKQIASDMIVKPYSPDSAKIALDQLSRLLRSAEEIRHVPRILDECGIRLVIVEALSATKIDGVCFWLNDRSPVIGLSLRHDRIDNFWFVLRHEIEHVLRLHGREPNVVMLDADLEDERAGTGTIVAEEERLANAAAAEFCVSKRMLESFIARKAPFFAEKDLLGFAKTIGVHPGLVAGQLGHHTGRYDRFRDHLVKIRSIIAPGSLVDGWGDVAPVES